MDFERTIYSRRAVREYKADPVDEATIRRLDDPDFQAFYHAPALIVISSASQGRWAAENCALAAQNLMLAARDAGLGSWWIG